MEQTTNRTETQDTKAESNTAKRIVGVVPRPSKTEHWIMTQLGMISRRISIGKKVSAE
jgi:hypothetical protein